MRRKMSNKNFGQSQQQQQQSGDQVRLAFLTLSDIASCYYCSIVSACSLLDHDSMVLCCSIICCVLLLAYSTADRIVHRQLLRLR
jgi:hypothetical protein